MDETKSIRQIRIRFSDLTMEEKDPFIRYWIISVYGNRGLGNRVDEKGKDVRVFVDTGANVNTMSRSQLVAFFDNDAKDMVMGVNWFQRVTNGGANDSNIRILDMRNFGVFM